MNCWQWLPIDEAAERLQMVPRVLRRWIDARRVDCETVDGVRFVWLADVVQERRRQRVTIAELRNELKRRGFASGCRPGVPAER